jgi:hypothetical protein
MGVTIGSPIFRADLGIWDISANSFTSLRSLVPPVALGVGSNTKTFDFVFEDLYLGSPGYTVALRLQVINTNGNVCDTWDLYTISLKGLAP